jgi:hypothetical protein
MTDDEQHEWLAMVASRELNRGGCRPDMIELLESVVAKRLRIDPASGATIVVDHDGAPMRGVSPSAVVAEVRAKYRRDFR